MTMETQRKWNAVFDRFDSSSLTAVQFCRLHDLNTRTFYNMRSRFKHSAGLSHIAAYIYPRLKEYREWCAEHLYQSEDQREDYVKKLDKMIVAFKIILARELGDPTQYVWGKEIADKKIEKGLKLFAKNFESFWA